MCRESLGIMVMRNLVATSFVVCGLVGCEQATVQVEESTSAPPGTTAVEAAPAPDIHHWTNDKDIGGGGGPVTSEHLLASPSNPEQWLLYGGDYGNHRHSPIDDITPENASRLQVAWAFPTGTTEQFEVSPTVYDGIMYVTTSFNRIFALDAANGEIYWRYDHQQPDDLRLCCGNVNRGAAIAGDLVLMATLDAKLIAFDRLTGTIAWEKTIADYTGGFSATSMPMIVKDMAIIGVAGGEFGVRGFFDAYDVATGELRWRHYTLPAEGEPGSETWAGDSYKTGGSPAWTSGAYDPETDILYWTTGNPSPDWNGDLRAGDNLYSNSLLAVDPDTGERLWHFQFTPHDVWDYDGNTQIFLTDVKRGEDTVKAIVQANRNGYFYTLDRATGAFMSATQYVEQLNWATIDDNGRPIVDPRANPTEEPDFRVCPGNLGGMNGAYSGALNPDLGLAYIPVIESCQQFQKGIVAFVRGQPFMGGEPIVVDVTAGTDYGHLSAVDINTGEVRWRYKDPEPMMAGALSTAGGVVFTGTRDGFALALDAATGDELWKFRMGGGVRSQPVAYRADGKTYVAMGSGNDINIASFAAGSVAIPEGGHLFVFVLAD
ncbi:MAG: PQQ-dependent dehydrogenase, methanol/ethanol family [Gammaproteobacteria bacterium]|nr:PQQ-dependent dehydrogenase, methanol/ethanol family [Gammaproteobacteria bacterium]